MIHLSLILNKFFF